VNTRQEAPADAQEKATIQTTSAFSFLSEAFSHCNRRGANRVDNDAASGNRHEEVNDGKCANVTTDYTDGTDERAFSIRDIRVIRG
jgi:hypothetical protein